MAASCNVPIRVGSLSSCYCLAIPPILAYTYRWAFAAFLRLVPDAKRRLRQITAGRLRTPNSASK